MCPVNAGGELQFFGLDVRGRRESCLCVQALHPQHPRLQPVHGQLLPRTAGLAAMGGFAPKEIDAGAEPTGTVQPPRQRAVGEMSILFIKIKIKKYSKTEQHKQILVFL